MKEYKPYNMDQLLLLPPSMRDWLSESHLALFVSDVVEELNLSPIFAEYEKGDGKGSPPYHPLMMVKLLMYAYCDGKFSSRKIEKATYDEVPYRVLSGDQHPDHDTISEFRRRHLDALSNLFNEVLVLCEQAGLIKLGHVSLDGSKIKANASKHKAMSYGRMQEKEKSLEEEVRKLLDEAERIDSEEDKRYGKGRRGDELPKELAHRESRLKKIREAKAALEKEARERAQQKASEVEQKLEERERQEKETGKKKTGPPPTKPDPDKAEPSSKSQRNFTDPDSRIMKDGATKSFEQAYNAQIAVDGEAQIIVSHDVTQDANDKKQLAPMIEKIVENLGRLPDAASADSGYCSADNLNAEELKDVDLYIAPDKEKHGEQSKRNDVVKEKDTGIIEIMRQKLQTEAGRAIYKMRKAIVEPVFGQIKQIRGFRRFSLRGIENVAKEWAFVCLTHNLLKLFRCRYIQNIA
jgi:transposase